jgi:hypothetical protein
MILTINNRMIHDISSKPPASPALFPESTLAFTLRHRFTESLG